MELLGCLSEADRMNGRGVRLIKSERNACQPARPRFDPHRVSPGLSQAFGC